MLTLATVLSSAPACCLPSAIEQYGKGLGDRHLRIGRFLSHSAFHRWIFAANMLTAKHCAQFVCKHGDQAVFSVIAKDGRHPASVIDTNVYSNNQQYRCMGCSKDGHRTLKPIKACCTFEQSLVVPTAGQAVLLPLMIPINRGQAVGNIVAMSPAHVQHAVPAVGQMCCPSLSRYISQCLGGGTIYDNASLHNSYASTSASLYLSTSIRQCAKKVHSSNTIKVEICFKMKAWRTLCRSASCMSCGPWIVVPAEILQKSSRQAWGMQLQTWAEKWFPTH